MPAPPTPPVRREASGTLPRNIWKDETRVSHRVTLIPGDGTGPEIAEATRRVLEATGVDLRLGRAGRRRRRHGAGTAATRCPTTCSSRSAATASPSRARSRRRSAPASARSTSACARRSTSTRRCGRASTTPACAPATPTPVDLVIVRENTEDLYAGIEFERGRTASARSPRRSSALSGAHDPRRLRHLDQADLRVRHPPGRAVRVRLRPRERPQQGDRRCTRRTS